MYLCVCVCFLFWSKLRASLWGTKLPWTQDRIDIKEFCFGKLHTSGNVPFNLHTTHTNTQTHSPPALRLFLGNLTPWQFEIVLWLTHSLVSIAFQSGGMQETVGVLSITENMKM